MRYALLLTGLFVIAAVQACGSEPRNDSSAGASQDVLSGVERADTTSAAATLPDSTYDQRLAALMDAGRSFGSSEVELRSNLGEPLEVTRTGTTNRHTGETDTLLHVLYEGLDVELYRTSNGRDLLSSVTLTGNTHAPDLPFRIGATKQNVTSHLGPPVRTEPSGGGNERLVYETDFEPVTNTLFLTFAENRLANLSWSFYLD